MSSLEKRKKRKKREKKEKKEDYIEKINVYSLHNDVSFLFLNNIHNEMNNKFIQVFS